MSSFLDLMKSLFLQGSPITDGSAATDADLEGGYAQRKSISDQLPWLGVVGNDDCVLLEDGYSVAGVLEIMPISTEARSLEYLIERRDALQRAINNTFPGHDRCPWILQCYAFPEKSEYRKFPERLKAYARDRQSRQAGELHPYTDWFIDQILTPHVEDMSHPEGFFIDDTSGQELAWGGNLRKVYLVIYRRLPRGLKLRRGLTPEVELDGIAKKFMMNLSGAGIRCTRLKGEVIRNWLFRWFNPSPTITDGDVDAYLAMRPYLESDAAESLDFLPFDYSLADDVVSGDVRSDKKTKNWYFDGVPHTVLTVERLAYRPEIGVLSAERELGDSCISLLDQLPPHTVLCITIVVQPRSATKRHLDILEKRSKGQTEEAAATRAAIQHAREQLLSGNDIYPVTIAVLLRAEDDEQLEECMEEITSKLGTCGLELIGGDDDVYRLDSYLRHIPMGYDHRLDQISRRNRLMYSQHLANLLPVYGRDKGTGNPGLVFSNRGGEPFTADPLNLADRSRNAHLFLYGPTGSGKSATLVYLQMLIMAIYRPRFVVVEAGNSFGLLTQFFQERGLTTVDYILTPGIAPSLAPFQPAMELIDERGQMITQEAAKEAAEADGSELSQRDIMSEMLIIGQIMVTGCIPSEQARYSRQDGAIIKEAILNAAKAARLAGQPYLITEDVIRALRALKVDRPTKAERIDEMADAMALYVDGFAGELFNRPGEELPDVDYIRIELGSLAGGNDTKDKLSVAYISLMNQIIARAKRTKKDGRNTIALTDECHVITTEPLLAKYLVVLAKLLGRRDAVWLWMATQNMGDFPGDAAKILSMFEWWLVLSTNKKELEDLEKYKPLTADERNMLLNTKKVPKKFVEGVLFSDAVQGLFRNVPPAPCLLLAGTEKEEKRDREMVMIEKGCSELDAAFVLAERLRDARRASIRDR